MTSLDLIAFLNKQNYDIRKTNNARWIDQKCTMDVINVIADCILVFTKEDNDKEFTTSDIWHSQYSRDYVIDMFSKPDPELKAKNEYDKYFGQPIKLLDYSGVLNSRKSGNKYIYKVANRKILSYISFRETNTLNFLYEYITKVLKDSDLYIYFEEFFREQSKDYYRKLRDAFDTFMIENTPINGKTECGRIFTKIVNPLAFKLKKLGTERGHISKHIIRLEELKYNRINWRDELSEKDKSVTRKEYELHKKTAKDYAVASYKINKAKRAVRSFNDKFRFGKSEIKQFAQTEKATQIHHIFPQSEFPQISDFLENLIALTPTQHYSYAHPDNKTMYVDKDYQYICLLAKSFSIMKNLLVHQGNEMYSFDDYTYVLDTGLATDEFSYIPDLDFAAAIDMIDYYYSDYVNNGKYQDIKAENNPVLR